MQKYNNLQEKNPFLKNETKILQDIINSIITNHKPKKNPHIKKKDLLLLLLLFIT
jgi:hypothetical protein